MEWAAWVGRVGKAVDAVGIAVTVVGALVASGVYLRTMRHVEAPDPYTRYRRGIGRAILLGLEFLVAADIIRTVAIAPTFTSVGVLAVIVLIRTFLSFSLQLEIDGRVPWQRHDPPSALTAGPQGGGIRAPSDAVDHATPVSEHTIPPASK